MKKIAITGFITLFSLNIHAAPIDLSSWSELTLDFAGGQPAGNWNLGAGNTSVTQTTNADPSFYLNNLNQTSYSIDGSWQVTTVSDNDFMGFVFGYQNSSNFYLFDWRQDTQNGVYGSNASEGMTIKKFQGGTGDGITDLSLGEFWENNIDKGDMTILAQNQSATAGWLDNILYDFNLDFNINSGEFSVNVSQAGTTLWNTTITDSTFTSGQFGFYNFSQSSVKYAGFEQAGGIIVGVPEPISLGLFGAGLLGLIYSQKRKEKIPG